MSEVTLKEIVEYVGGRISGAKDVSIVGVAPLADATERHLSFLANPKYLPQVESTRAAAILVSNDLPGDSDRWIRVADPYFAMASVVARFFAGRPAPKGISPMASIAPSAKLGSNVAVGSFTSIGDEVVIGDNVTIYSNVAIESASRIGEGTIIYPQVSIYERSIIGRRCILHSGVVIGSDGYGFATHQGRHHKIPQVGIVRVEDDVEIGAGTTVDRAALGETVIGEGTKIDNLVQIGHNVRIGRHCLIVAQVGIAGSTELGDYVAAAGQVGIGGHLKIGKGAQLGAKSAVLHDVDDGAKVMGNPAVPFREFARRELALKRLTKRGPAADEKEERQKD